QCESDVLQIASISSRRICFCLSVRVLHFEKSFCCSSVNRDSSPSAKNWASVMPNALHTASEVGSVGALFLLNIFVTVEWERLASFASRSSVQFRPSISSLIRFCASISSPTYLSLFYVPERWYNSHNR